MKRVGIFVHPRWAAASQLAEEVQRFLAGRVDEVWKTFSYEDSTTPERVPGTDLMICLGGDGTVLRCARMVIGLPVVILGVNMGRLGFLTELNGSEVRDRLGDVLSGKGRIEERLMLDATVPGRDTIFHALNEVVIGRATLSRAIQLAVDIDDIRVADYRCDGVIIATATGSTAYALSVGGPVLHPESRDLVVVPVAPHLAARHALVLPRSEVVHVTLEERQQAVLSVDGEADLDLREGDSVFVKPSQHRAHFLRFHPRTDFYKRMAAQLGWHRPGGSAQPLP